MSSFEISATTADRFDWRVTALGYSTAREARRHSNSVNAAAGGSSRRLQAGFTLIELLVVIAIIGVLSAISIVNLSVARATARDAKRTADIRALYTAYTNYYFDHGNALLDSTSDPDCQYTNGVFGNASTCSAFEPYFYGLPEDPLGTIPAAPDSGSECGQNYFPDQFSSCLCKNQWDGVTSPTAYTIINRDAAGSYELTFGIGTYFETGIPNFGGGPGFHWLSNYGWDRLDFDNKDDPNFCDASAGGTP